MKASDAKEMIRGFETGTWPKEQWTHYAHFVMALWYCYHLPLPAAKTQIKEGIKKYNITTGGQNTAESGYHETITVFYTRSIIHYLQQVDDAGNLEALLGSLNDQPFLAKDFLLRYYSKELLMSKEARKNWVLPDKQALPF